MYLRCYSFIQGGLGLVCLNVENKLGVCGSLSNGSKKSCWCYTFLWRKKMDVARWGRYFLGNKDAGNIDSE